ncbi:MAG: transposase [Acidobacteriota bacterium]
MPRAPRVFLDGGFYHVYGRISRGERVFSDPEEATRFAAVIADVKRRDGFAVLAWCVMANHYHLAVRTAGVPLWRSIRLIQWRYASEHNRRRRQLGPLWQGRYHARLVADERYLLQLVAYIHLNPVTAGLVDDPASYGFSGHSELLRRGGSPIVDADVTLALFGADRAAARRAYLRMLRGERPGEWAGEGPERLPWWRVRGGDDVLSGAWDSTLADAAGPQRARIQDVGRYLEVAAAALGVAPAGLGGRGKAPAIVRAREILAIVGVERFGVRMSELAGRLGMHAGSVSHWAARAAARRREDTTFARRCREVEEVIAARLRRRTPR